MDDDLLIRVEGVSKKFPRDLSSSMHYGLQDLFRELFPAARQNNQLRPHEFWAVKDVSFDVRRGESLALIGPNGAGKSTLLRMLMGRPKLTQGRISIHAHMAAVTELGVGFSPTQTGLENIYNSSAVLGLPRRKTHALVDEIVEFAGLSEFLDMPVQNYSTGMRARLGFAIATHVNPEVLLIDEALAVGDLGFKRKCIQRLMQFVERGGSLIAVAHDMYSLQRLCSQSLLLHQGQVLFHGPIIEGVKRCFELFRELEDPPERARASPTEADELPLAGSELSVENPIRIDAVSLEPLAGEQLTTDSPARVVLRYTSRVSMEDGFVWAFTFLTADQMIRIGSGIRLQENRAYKIELGAGTLTAIIPRLPLVGGQYAVSAAIVDAETRRSIARIGHDDAAPTFQVAAPANELNNIRAMRGELIPIDVVWAGDPGFADP